MSTKAGQVQTALVERLIDDEWNRSSPLEVLGRFDINESSVSERLSTRILSASNDQLRREAAQEAKALALSTQNAGHVLSETCLSLLASGSPRANISFAARVVEAIPQVHAKTRPLSTAFKEACKRHNGYRLTEAEGLALRSAGITVTEKMLPPKKRKKVLGFIPVP